MGQAGYWHSSSSVVVIGSRARTFHGLQMRSEPFVRALDIRIHEDNLRSHEEKKPPDLQVAMLRTIGAKSGFFRHRSRNIDTYCRDTFLGRPPMLRAPRVHKKWPQPMSPENTVCFPHTSDGGETAMTNLKHQASVVSSLLMY